LELVLAANAAAKRERYDEVRRLDDILRRVTGSAQVGDSLGHELFSERTRVLVAMRSEQTRLGSVTARATDRAPIADLHRGQRELASSIDRLSNQPGAASERSTLVAAHAHAAAATAALAASPPDLATARREQDAVDRALGDAWRAATRDAALRRLSSVPGMAQIFTSTDAVASPVNGHFESFAASGDWARLRAGTAAQVNRGAGEKSPIGYEDALTVYFETLAQTPSSRPTTATEGP
jgi:hypothetical protein